MTDDQAARIEEKLDRIIAYFNIGRVPERTPTEIEEMARRSIEKYRNKQRGADVDATTLKQSRD